MKARVSGVALERHLLSYRFQSLPATEYRQEYPLYGELSNVSAITLSDNINAHFMRVYYSNLKINIKIDAWNTNK